MWSLTNEAPRLWPRSASIVISLLTVTNSTCILCLFLCLFFLLLFRSFSLRILFTPLLFFLFLRRIRCRCSIRYRSRCRCSIKSLIRWCSTRSVRRINNVSRRIRIIGRIKLNISINRRATLINCQRLRFSHLLRLNHLRLRFLDGLLLIFNHFLWSLRFNHFQLLRIYRRQLGLRLKRNSLGLHQNS